MNTKVLFVSLALMLISATANMADTNKPSAPVDSSQQIADKIIKSKIPVMVDFWAVWCRPCTMLNPIMKELEEEYKGKVLFLKVNVDIHKAISSYFGISAIPAVFILNNKTVQKVLPGLNPKEAYTAAINEALVAAALPATPKPEPPKNTPQQ